MRISKHTIVGQAYILPSIKITYDTTLNGEYELIFGWISVGISLSFEPKPRMSKLDSRSYIIGSIIGIFAGITIGWLMFAQ